MMLLRIPDSSTIRETHGKTAVRHNKMAGVRNRCPLASEAISNAAVKQHTACRRVDTIVNAGHQPAGSSMVKHKSQSKTLHVVAVAVSNKTVEN